MNVNINNLIRDYNAKAAQPRTKKDYPMLRLTKNNSLEVILHSDASKWEKFLKWIGVGPLSLKNISEQLDQNKKGLNKLRFKAQNGSENTEEGSSSASSSSSTSSSSSKSTSSSSTEQEDVTNQDIETFAKGLLNQYQRYNAHRLINKIQATNFEAVNNLVGTVMQTDNTYNDPTNAGNIDFVFANNHNGFAFVVDSTGHNKPLKRPTLSVLYEGFNKSYQEDLASQKFHSMQDVEDFIGSTTKAFANKVSNHDTPSFSLAQIVSHKDSLHLVTAQVGDTMVVVKRGDDFIFVRSHPPSSGFGAESLTLENMAVFPGDEVFGFSDGIAEYLSEETFKEVINKNQDRAQLLADLREEIQTGKQIDGDLELWERPIKQHDLVHNYDDLSLFILDVSKFTANIRF